MGTDIHLYVEVKDEKGEWKSAHKWEKKGEGGYVWWDALGSEKYDPGRNYRLFAMLADVRNGFGFAGVDMGDALNPIDDPRGLPNDIAPETQRMADLWDADGHSHSWFTVEELLRYDWTQEVVNRGVVSGYEYWRWNLWDRKEGRGPESYAGDVSGRDVQYLTEEQMMEIIKEVCGDNPWNWKHEEAIKTAMENKYVRVSWTEKYYQMAQYFLSHNLPELLRLGRPRDVRIVFWFDN